MYMKLLKFYSAKAGYYMLPPLTSSLWTDGKHQYKTKYQNSRNHISYQQKFIINSMPNCKRDTRNHVWECIYLEKTHAHAQASGFPSLLCFFPLKRRKIISFIIQWWVTAIRVGVGSYPGSYELTSLGCVFWLKPEPRWVKMKFNLIWANSDIWYSHQEIPQTHSIPQL